MKKVSKLLTICIALIFTLVMVGAAVAKPGANSGKELGAKNGQTDSTVAVQPTANAQETVTNADLNGQTERFKEQVKNKGQEEQKIERFQHRVKVNGKEVKFDVPPVIKDGRTLIPVRGLMNSLGATVAWDETTQTVTVTKDDKVVVLTLGSDVVLVNGQETKIDVPAQLISNRTLVPLRFLAETFGKIVKYDPETGEIDVNEGETSPITETETGTEPGSGTSPLVDETTTTPTTAPEQSVPPTTTQQ